jgi:hypothetical protein
MNIKAHSIALPAIPLHNPAFEYRHSWNTNLRETWRKAREEQRKSMVIHREFNNARP